MRKSAAQRSVGNSDYALEWSVELEDHEDRARNRESGHEENRNDSGVSGRKETEADENDRQPEHQQHEEEYGNRAAPLLEEQPAGLSDVDRHLGRLSLQGSLCVVLRHEFEDLVVEDFAGPRSWVELDHSGAVFWPNLIEDPRNAQ